MDKVIPTVPHLGNCASPIFMDRQHPNGWGDVVSIHQILYLLAHMHTNTHVCTAKNLFRNSVITYMTTVAKFIIELRHLDQRE